VHTKLFGIVKQSARVSRRTCQPAGSGTKSGAIADAASVFLDDPVTHFDDLNTCALLDLIVGLRKSDFGTRQFIISTCDDDTPNSI